MIPFSSFRNEALRRVKSQSTSTFECGDSTLTESSGEFIFESVPKYCMCRQFPTCADSECRHPHQIQELLKTEFLSLTDGHICTNYHINLECSLGENCPFVHEERSSGEIISTLRMGNRLSLLELLQSRAGAESLIIKWSNL